MPLSTLGYFVVSGISFPETAVFNASVAERSDATEASKRHLLLEARNTGCKIAVLQATNMGLPIYRKLGFKEYCKTGILVLIP
jgi:hypothetical protein